MQLQDGREVFCRIHRSGSPLAPTMVLVHGGPGESCLSFQACIPELTSFCNVLEMDQRGCGRSQQECDPHKITVRQVIADMDEIRTRFGIERWVVWGHSFGGRLALAYARTFPQNTQALILENPAIDISDGVHCILRGYASYFGERGRLDQARQAARAALDPDVVRCLAAIDQVGNRDKQAFWGNDRLPESAARLLDMRRLPQDFQRRCLDFFHAMKLDPTLLDSGWELLSAIRCPVLLLRGDADPIMDNALMERFRLHSPGGKIAVIPHCGHYIHLANIPGMTRSVRKFFTTCL